MKMLNKTLKTLLFAGCLAVLPGTVQVVWSLLSQMIQQPEPSRYFLLGVALCVVIQNLFRHRLLMLETLSHETAHTLAAVACLRKVSEFRVTSRAGGYVKVEGENWFIALAPYWIPLFAIPMVLLSFLTQLNYRIYFEGAIGFAYCFHLYQAWHSLAWRQPDLRLAGITFSVLVLPTLNLLSTAFVVNSVTSGQQGIPDTVSQIYQASQGLFQYAATWIRSLT